MLSLLLALTASAEPVLITPTLGSPALFSADLDEDGEIEQISVGFSILREVVVSVYEPGGGIARLNLGAVEDFSGVRDELLASVTEASLTGVPLVQALVPAAEQCGSWDRDFYVSYRSPGAGTPGTLRLAIETINGSDAPMYTEQTVVFHPDSRTARLTAVDGSDYGETTTITRHAFVDGVFKVTETRTTEQVF